MSYMLYRADEIRIGDELVGIGKVRRIDRKIGSIDLYWALMPNTFVRVGLDTQVLAQRPVSAAPTIAEQSQSRGAA